MKATTIKVDGELLAELERTRPPAQSLTAFVRSTLWQAIRRRQLLAAAERYGEFLRRDAAERTWLEEWDRADLARPPRRRRT